MSLLQQQAAEEIIMIQDYLQEFAAKVNIINSTIAWTELKGQNGLREHALKDKQKLIQEYQTKTGLYSNLDVNWRSLLTRQQRCEALITILSQGRAKILELYTQASAYRQSKYGLGLHTDAGYQAIQNEIGRIHSSIAVETGLPGKYDFTQIDIKQFVNEEYI